MELGYRNPTRSYPELRNLIYHLTPIGRWWENLDLLHPYWELFNGKRIIAVAEDNDFEDTAKDVERYISTTFPDDFEILVCENDKELRESATLMDLLTSVHSLRPEEFTFYGHSKGVTHDKKKEYPAVKLWTEALHIANLASYLSNVRALLDIFPVVGSFAKYGKFKHFPAGSTWHYSGTFYWFRNSDLFRKNWYDIPIERYTAEAYSGLLYKSNEMGVAFYDGVGNLYNHRYLEDLLSGRIKAKKNNRNVTSIPNNRVRTISRTG